MLPDLGVGLRNFAFRLVSVFATVARLAFGLCRDFDLSVVAADLFFNLSDALTF